MLANPIAIIENVPHRANEKSRSFLEHYIAPKSALEVVIHHKNWGYRHRNQLRGTRPGGAPVGAVSGLV